MAVIGSVVAVLAVVVDLWRRRRHTRHVRRTPSAVLVAEVRRQLRMAAPGAEALIVPDDVGRLSIDMIKEIAADEGLTYCGGVRRRNAPLHLRFRAPSGAAARIVADAIAPQPVGVADRPAASSSPGVPLTTDPLTTDPLTTDRARPTGPPVSPVVGRLLNLVVAAGAVVVLPLGLLLVPEIRRDAALAVPLLVLSALAVGPFVWSVVRARTAWRLRDEQMTHHERCAEHPFLAHLRDAEPDRHGVLAVDLTAHPDVDAGAVEDMVAAAGWDVVSGEEQRLYLCRSVPSRADGSGIPPVGPPRPPVPPGVRTRQHLGAWVFAAGLVTVCTAAFWPDQRVAIAVAVTSMLVGTLLIQWARG